MPVNEELRAKTFERFFEAVDDEEDFVLDWVQQMNWSRMKKQRSCTGPKHCDIAWWFLRIIFNLKEILSRNEQKDMSILCWIWIPRWKSWNFFGRSTSSSAQEQMKIPTVLTNWERKRERWQVRKKTEANQRGLLSWETIQFRPSCSWCEPPDQRRIDHDFLEGETLTNATEKNIFHHLIVHSLEKKSTEVSFFFFVSCLCFSLSAFFFFSHLAFASFSLQVLRRSFLSSVFLLGISLK